MDRIGVCVVVAFISVGCEKYCPAVLTGAKEGIDD